MRQYLCCAGSFGGAIAVEIADSNSAVWEIQVQLCTNVDIQPIEDASVTWPQTESPYLSVARLHKPAQHTWRADRVELVDESNFHHEGLPSLPYPCAHSSAARKHRSRERFATFLAHGAFRFEFCIFAYEGPTRSTRPIGPEI
jgi:hypothetical protein